MRHLLRPPVPRPLAVSIIGLGVGALSVFPVVLGVAALIQHLSSAAPKAPSGSMPESLMLWALLGIPLVGCLAIVVSMALLDLRAWARDLMTAFFWVQAGSAGLGLLGLLQPHAHLSAECITTPVATVLVAVAGLNALRKPQVREAFVAAEAARRATKLQAQTHQ